MTPPDAGTLPGIDVPRNLREIWLAYHETELCQDLAATFVFRADGMEVWCAIEEEKAYRKLADLIDARTGKLQSELYPTRLPEEKKSRAEKGPPPSLWHNDELRAHLRDPFEQAAGRIAFDRAEDQILSPDDRLKMRMISYAEQALDWAARMKKYGADLPLLAWAAFAAGAAPDMKLPAKSVCEKHARELGKHAGRLGEHLLRAFPKGSGQGRLKEAGAQSRQAGGSPLTFAALVSDAARDVARRVYLFIYPEKHTVGLIGLRNPDLLQALNELERMAAEFQVLLLSAKPR